MGIDTCYYTVYGVKIDWDEDFAEAYDEVYDNFEKNCSNASVIMDSMGGDYMVIGYRLFTSGNIRWNDVEDTFVEIDTSMLTNYRVDVMQEFAKYFPKFTSILDKEWKMMTFIHYS